MNFPRSERAQKLRARWAKGIFLFRLDNLDALLGQGNAGVQLKSYQQNEGVEIHPYHDDDHSTNGAIQLVVGIEIVDIESKAGKC